METNKAITKEGLKWRCKNHPTILSDIICLEGYAEDRVMCFRCYQVNPVPLENLMSMRCVLDSKEHDIFETYPPLKDQELSNKLRQVGIQQSIEEIDLYFKKLSEDCEREIIAAQKRAKEIFIKKEQASQKILDEYFRIAEIEKLKELIVSDKEGAEKDLDEFIKDKWNKAEENRRILKELMYYYETEYYFSSNEPNRIAQQMIDSLEIINFFEQQINKQEIKLIKSTFDASQQLSIFKTDQQIYQIKQEVSGNWGQVFLDPILNPLHKYVFQVELEQKLGNSSNYFFAGIVTDEGKDDNDAYLQNMCYYDYSNDFGITKYIKGSPMQSGSKQTGKHSFEIRIHLDRKVLRVASLPNYSSIAELDDPNKINPKINYRFFLAIGGKGNMIRINNVSVVNKFDRKM